MRKTGLAFHCHHDTLMEYVYDYDERVRYIKSHKPKEEQKLRLRLFKIIPRKLLPAEGLDAYHRAGDAYYKAQDVYGKAWGDCNRAWEAYYRAWEAYAEARDAYLGKHEGAIRKLHSELCPNCPWDGKTIFGGRV